MLARNQLKIEEIRAKWRTRFKGVDEPLKYNERTNNSFSLKKKTPLNLKSYKVMNPCIN